MAEPIYAVIAYVAGGLGNFVDEQRDRLNPEYAAALAHVTVLPPRALAGWPTAVSPAGVTPAGVTPEATLAFLGEQCARLEPFDLSVDGVGTFWPAKGVVYLSFSKGSDQLIELHRLLNSGELECAEPFPFIPHLTIAQELDEEATKAVLAAVSREWERYEGDRSFRIETLCLVRQGEGHRWINLAPIPLSSFFYAARP